VKYPDGASCYTDTCLKNTLGYFNTAPGASVDLSSNAKVGGGRQMGRGVPAPLHPFVQGLPAILSRCCPVCLPADFVVVASSVWNRDRTAPSGRCGGVRRARRVHRQGGSVTAAVPPPSLQLWAQCHRP
jgi:hypothetical protein